MHIGRSSIGAVVVASLVLVAVLALPASAIANDNEACLSCHAITEPFAVAAVDRDTVCASCHAAGLLGTHPYHQPGSNCGAYCHPGWGDSLLTAVPNVIDPSSGAAFASTTSKDTPASILHIIHSRPRWPQNVDYPDSRCASCHAAASCDACHTGSIDPGHENHSSTLYEPYAGTFAHGVPGGDQSVWSVADEQIMCATSGCHNIEGTRAKAPVTRENFSHKAYPEHGLPEPNTVTYTPSSSAWPLSYSSDYTAGRMSYSNYAGATLSIQFTGERVVLVADKDPYRGIAEVLVDGVVAATVDLYAPTTTYQAVVFDSGQLDSGSHTVTVRATGTKNPSARHTFVTVDCFKVYASLPGSIAPECTSACHADKLQGHGFSHEATHTVGAYPAYPDARYACTDCHSLYLTTEHGRSSSKTAAAGCDACHTVYADFVLDDYDFTCTWNAYGPGCHQSANGEDPHNFTDSDHDASALPGTAECRECHGNDLAQIHDDQDASRPVHASLSTNAYATDCLTCHGTDKFPTTKDCTDSGCHVASGVVDMDTHPAPPHVASAPNAGVERTGGHACSTCHVLELTSEHSKGSAVTDPGGASITCGVCHSASYFPVGWMATPGTSDTCTACHDPAGALDAGAPHEAADYSAKHDYSAYDVANSTSCAGADCHDVTAADALHDPALPANGSCTSCHTTNTAVPDKRLCADCHTASPHDMVAAHDGSSAAYAANGDCVACHVGHVDLTTHASSCAGCHENPVLTDYLQTGYTARCQDCHNSTYNLGSQTGTYDYQPYDPNHYDPYLASHTADYTGQSVPTGGLLVTDKSCTACHANSLKAEHIYTLSSGPVDCIGCHTSTLPIDAVAVVNADWPTNRCGECHGANHGGLGIAAHDMTGAGTSCEGSDCHSDSGDIALLHADAVDGAATACNVCHQSADTDLSTKTSCTGPTGCHTGHNMTVHITSASQECVDCHESGDVRNVHAGCSTCHGNPAYPTLPGTNTAECTQCHGDEVGSKTYSPIDPGHYVGTETTHTASAQSGMHGGFACSHCHAMEMKPEHITKASSAFSTVPGTYPDKCVACHEAKVDALGVWDKTCTACHATNHSEQATKHDASAIAPDCGGAGCHATADVAAIHATAPADCATCHVDETAVPGTIDCASAGCHAGVGVHSHDLDTVSSAYNDTTISGCTDSGAGCHGTDSNANYQEYHPISGCLDGPCHTSASQPDPAFDNPNSCQVCHTDGAYVGAPDTVALTAAAPNGHYDLTRHTATGGLGTVSAGGSASAVCSACHTLDLFGAHQGPQFSSTTMGTNVTCAECHTAAVDQVKTYAWSTDSCADCHDGTVAGSVHGASAPVVAGSSTAGCGASGAGCHSTYDLHELHADRGCALSGCHDGVDKDMSSAAKTCGQASGCHTAATYSASNHAGRTGDDTVHGATGNSGQSLGGYTYGTACADCHTLTLETAHSGTTLGWTAPYCTDCHNATTPIDSVSVIKTTGWTNKRCEDCHTTKHDTYTAAAHTATAASGCSIGSCHGASGGTLDVRSLHDNQYAGCSTAGTDSNGWTGACHQMDTAMSSAAMSCGSGATGLACHTGHTDTNHGGSTGGRPCDECHTALTGMVDDINSYHHVLDDPDPFQAPGGGPYPTSQDDMSCVSCHLDHSEYQALPGGSGKAFNLRDNATVAYPNATDTDDALCLSCHTTNRPRNTTGQKANTIPESVVWYVNQTYWATSPHNYTSDGPFNDGSEFRANCAKCHGSLNGTLSTGKFSVHFSAEQRLLNALGDPTVYEINEEQMCFRCHSLASDFAVNGGTQLGIPKPSDYVDWYGTQPMKQSNVVIYQQMMDGNNTFGHKPHEYSGIHLLDEADEDWDYISANKHVECADCHNHHAVGTARHEWGTTNEVSPALQGVTGVGYSSFQWTSNYPNVTRSGLTWKSEADYEYEICFKCHSAANTDLAGWGGDKFDAPGVQNWTNVAQDFAVGNNSRHPVVAPLEVTDPSTNYGAGRLYPGQLLDIWAPGDTMYCSDCHGDENAPLYSDPDAVNHPQGPHGSSLRYSLRGPRTSWPVDRTTGDPITINMVQGGYDDLFCMNCHPNVGGNKVHSNNTNHKVVPCYYCHILVPHGGRMSRLMGDHSTMPARLAWQGDLNNMQVESFSRKDDPLLYQRKDCSVANNGVCGSHNTGNDTRAGYENW